MLPLGFAVLAGAGGGVDGDDVGAGIGLGGCCCGVVDCGGDGVGTGIGLGGC